MPTFLSVQSTYEQVEIALFKDSQMVASSATHKFNASSELVLAIGNLLSSCSVTLSDITFIAINQGPGPFTTLRVAIATINGIGFSTGIPLVAVQGLPAFIAEHHKATTPVTIALLNAFNKDLYYAIAEASLPVQVGVENYLTLLHSLRDTYAHEQVQFIGNGATMFQAEIMELFPAQAQFPDPLPAFPSIEQIAKSGLIQWQQQLEITEQILPDYLKNYSAIIRYPTS